MTLLVSSVSARGRALRLGRDVVAALRAGGWEVHVSVTSTASDVEELSRTCSDYYIGALGGDGYLASAATGRVGHEGVLVPFPGGRGNDLCRYLGIGVDPVAWAQQLAEADRATMDRWTGPLDAVEVTSAEGTKTALGIISLGIDATANWVGNHSWLRSGPLAYAWGAVVGFAGGFKPWPIEARIDGRATELGGWLTSVSNTGWFGGGVNILPQSRADDGTLEIINVEKMSRLRALPLLGRALVARQIDHPMITVKMGRKIEMMRPVGLRALADGDVVGHLPLSMRVIPDALTVVAPGQQVERTVDIRTEK